MPQIITFSKVMVIYLYAMKIIQFGATFIRDHLFKKTTMRFICHQLCYNKYFSPSQSSIKTNFGWLERWLH